MKAMSFPPGPDDVSDDTRRDAGLSDPDLWMRYFELGGMQSPDEVKTYLRDGVAPSAHDHDVLAQALNERFSELGSNRTVRYGPEMSERSSLSPAGADVRLTVLGAFGLRIAGKPVDLPMNAQRLVCFLALHDGFLLRQHVAGSLWGETSDRRAAGSLRSALWRLGCLAHPLIEVEESHLRLSPFVDVDFRASETLARRLLDGSQQLSESDMDAALLSANLLADWTEDWVLVHREYHTQLRLRALESLCIRLVGMERFGQAVQAGIMAVSVEPLRESAQRALVVAHLAAGNVAAAVAQYDSFRKLLREELDLEPSPEMQALVEKMHR